MGGLIFLFRTGPPKNQGQPCTPPLELNSTHPPWFIYLHHLSALYLLLSCIVAPSIWAMRIAYESIRALDYPFIQLSDHLQTWSIGAGPCLTFTASLSGAMLHLHITSQEMYSPPSSTQTLHSVSHKRKHTYMKYSMLCNRKLKYFLKSYVYHSPSKCYTKGHLNLVSISLFVRSKACEVNFILLQTNEANWWQISGTCSRPGSFFASSFFPERFMASSGGSSSQPQASRIRRSATDGKC